MKQKGMNKVKSQVVLAMAMVILIPIQQNQKLLVTILSTQIRLYIDTQQPFILTLSIELKILCKKFATTIKDDSVLHNRKKPEFFQYYLKIEIA